MIKDERPFSWVTEDKYEPSMDVVEEHFINMTKILNNAKLRNEVGQGVRSIYFKEEKCKCEAHIESVVKAIRFSL
jgi:hypothetical protein